MVQLFSLYLLTFAILCLYHHKATANAYTSYTLDQISLNRYATRLAVSSSNIAKFPNFDLGFTWNDEDQDTTKWRPQGLSGITTTANKEFIAVSWYGREEEAYDDRGVRVAFVDVSDIQGTSDIMYRHVLLVDEKYKTFVNMHGGGLVQNGDLLHVPDSRVGENKVHTFSLSNIQYIPEADRDKFYNYEYVLPKVSSYSVPITPSFMSFDFARNKVILGTFYQCSSYHQDTSACLANTNDTLMWYEVGSVGSSSPYCAPFFSEMQGAASSTNTDGTTSVLWTSSSYGSSNISHLHITNLGSNFSCSTSKSFSNPGFREITYPSGLEDMHVSDPKSRFPNHLWMHTEFGTGDGKGNIRTVFATPNKFLMP